jgi:hypothetical protein
MRPRPSQPGLLFQSTSAAKVPDPVIEEIRRRETNGFDRARPAAGVTPWRVAIFIDNKIFTRGLPV